MGKSVGMQYKHAFQLGKQGLSFFSVYFIVALLDFESREYMYYYYILLGYCGETTERNQLGSYGSG